MSGSKDFELGQGSGYHDKVRNRFVVSLELSLAQV